MSPPLFVAVLHLWLQEATEEGAVAGPAKAIALCHPDLHHLDIVGQEVDVEPNCGIENAVGHLDGARILGGLAAVATAPPRALRAVAVLAVSPSSHCELGFAIGFVQLLKGAQQGRAWRRQRGH